MYSGVNYCCKVDASQFTQEYLGGSDRVLLSLDLPQDHRL